MHIIVDLILILQQFLVLRPRARGLPVSGLGGLGTSWDPANIAGPWTQGITWVWALVEAMPR